MSFFQSMQRIRLSVSFYLYKAPFSRLVPLYILSLLTHPWRPVSWQFRELAKYDVTGVGLNIGEVENGKGEVRLAVLGIVLGSPAQMMGVRQVSQSV